MVSILSFYQASFMKVFPMAVVEYCFFHFGQSLHRAVIRCGFKTRYETDRVFSSTIRAFGALAFLPVSEVENAFEELIEQEEVPFGWYALNSPALYLVGAPIGLCPNWSVLQIGLCSIG